MPGRRDCSLIGYGRIHHRSEHHEPRPRVARWACGLAPDGTAVGGRRRSASSMPALSTASAASTTSDTAGSLPRRA
jgi:hypothetical protein